MVERIEAAAAQTEPNAAEIIAGVRKIAHDGAERILDMGEEIAALINEVKRARETA